MHELKKILFFADAQLGDLILLTTALKALKEKLPYIKITLLLFHRRYYTPTEPHQEIIRSNFKGTSQVFMNCEFVDEVLELDRQYISSLKGFKRIITELKCIRFLKKMKFDSIICSFPQNRFVLWSFLSRSPLRIGQKDQPFSWLLTHTADVTAKQCGVQQYYCSLLKPLGVELEAGNTVYKVTDAEKFSAETLLKNAGIDLSKKIICIHPGASTACKVWPTVYYSRIIEYIIENNIGEIIICASSYDKESVEQILSFCSYKIPVLYFENITELAAVISKCSLLVGNNSGPRHLAQAVGVKTVSIFQKYDNGEWRIYDERKHPVAEHKDECSVCFNNKCESIIMEGERFGSKCLWDVTPDEVISKINDIL